MADKSNIEWTDSTFNPWIGCEAISRACDHCYAEAWAKRVGRDFGERRRTTEYNWKQPLKWEGDHEKFFAEHGRRRRVFCASLADVFDNKVDPSWRADLFRLIRQTPNLDWLLLTKRIGNAEKMIERALIEGHLLTSREPYWPWPNVWIGATIANQEEADRDVPKLMNIPARIRFVSCEPLLSSIKFADVPGFNKAGRIGREPLDNFWVIAGGESGPHARPSHPEWFRSLRDQCVNAGVPFIFKQWGEFAPNEPGAMTYGRGFYFANAVRYADFPDGQRVVRVGKKMADRLLDGRTWDEVPR